VVAARDSLDAREEVVDSSESRAEHVVPPTPVEREPVQETVRDTTRSDAQAKAAKAASEAKAARDAKAAKDAREAKLAAAAKAKSAAAEAARARSLLESKKPAGSERYVVQVGAFAEAGSARATRLKLERAGLSTYTNIAKTSGGDLIRVRVGPFTSRSEVDKAAAKVKALGLPARILTL
jgi:DedD protein